MKNNLLKSSHNFYFGLTQKARLVFINGPERKANMLMESIQQAKGSELTVDERKLIAEHIPTNEELNKAAEILESNDVGISPSEDDKLVSAKIIGALSSDRIPKYGNNEGIHGHWLLTEAFLLQGKDFSSIKRATVDDVIGGVKANIASLGSNKATTKKEYEILSKEGYFSPVLKSYLVAIAPHTDTNKQSGHSPHHKYFNRNI